MLASKRERTLRCRAQQCCSVLLGRQVLLPPILAATTLTPGMLSTLILRTLLGGARVGAGCLPAYWV